MIIVVRLEDMSDTLQGKKYHDLAHFAAATFDIKISDNGVVTIDGEESSVSYKIGNDKDSYTKQEAYINFSSSDIFKNYCKRHYYTAYLIKEQII